MWCTRSTIRKGYRADCSESPPEARVLKGKSLLQSKELLKRRCTISNVQSERAIQLTVQNFYQRRECLRVCRRRSQNKLKRARRRTVRSQHSCATKRKKARASIRNQVCTSGTTFDIYVLYIYIYMCVHL